MKETSVKGITLIASGVTKLTANETRKIVGGIFNPIIAEECGCCLCKPNESSKGAGEYTAIRSGN